MKGHQPGRRAARRAASTQKVYRHSGSPSPGGEPPDQEFAATNPFFSRLFFLTCVALIAVCVMVYAPVGHFGFLPSWDDPDYVTDNPHVAQGLTWQGAAWAFTLTDAANWHPLTWLSHMLDVQLYGMNAGPQHVTNLILHIFDTLLLFGLLLRVTGKTGRSAFVAALFALHPLHVESVAWISERKDVLSAFFLLLTMWAYAAYARRPRLTRYLLVVLLFAAGLMAKPMLVTLPFVLLLLDFWPLQRIQFGGAGGLRKLKPVLFRLLGEKLPLLALAIGSSIVTLAAHRSGGAVAALEKLPLVPRLTNAAASYLAYFEKMLWPVGLSAFYPFRTSTLVLRTSLGAAFLAGVTWLAVRAGRRHGYLPVGWLWYVVTLIPVIGLVQVGDQSMADRYTYIPLIGLFLIAAWGAPELAARWQFGRRALPAAAVCVLVACVALSRAQVQYWRDDGALWQHALDVTEDNPLAQSNVGGVLMTQGRVDEAVPHFLEAIRIRPNFAMAWYNLGLAAMFKGEVDEAIRYYGEALRNHPDLPQAQIDMGMALMWKGNLDEAAWHVGEAIRMKPRLAVAHSGMGRVLAAQGRLDEAIGQFSESLGIKPEDADTHNDLGVALARQGKMDEAAHQFTEALRLKPDFPDAGANLRRALATRPKTGH